MSWRATMKCTRAQAEALPESDDWCAGSAAPPVLPNRSTGTPAAATTTSARRTSAARSRVPVWHRVTVAFTSRRVSSSPNVRPTVMPRPTTVT